MASSETRRVGDYELDSQLARSDTGVVYRGRAPDGTPVAVKILTAAAERPDVPRIAGYHLAQVLDAGVWDGKPYIVTEYVPGPTLEAVVRRDGPLEETALHRLAIATMTALAGIHRTPAVHGALRPDNVVVGPDGPCLINAGVAAAVETSAAQATHRVEAPGYLAPERFEGRPPGQPGDLFSWACVIAYAATGSGPFDAGTPTGTMNRILNDEPDLSRVPQPLDDVLAACLAKDPGHRPTAPQALMALVGHTLRVIAPPAPEPPARPRRTGRLLMGAAAVALAALSAAGGHLVARATVAQPQPAATPAPTLSTVAAPREPTPPPAPTTSIKVPGVRMTLREHPTDPIRMTAYRVGEDTYVREGDTFVKSDIPGADPAHSPDGRWLALVAGTRVTLVDLAAKARHTVTTQHAGTAPTWSRDSRRLMLTVIANERYAGFLLIDPATRASSFVATDDTVTPATRNYAWLPDGSGVMIAHRSGIRLLDLNGRQLRTMEWVGDPWGRKSYSPDGRLFMTHCPSGGTYCFWDSEQGVRQATIALFTTQGGEAWEWYDDQHLIVAEPRPKPTPVHRLVTMDFRGQAGRVLAEIAAEDDTDDLVFYFTRRTR
ncbi:protein kinase domain-containing protein [Thermoactinospora rubra]|uniref:protein kinase domain-containing protein n=1 Tax=Thermoactinospora rubra TaxID=1088767 RepID=UPI00117D0878|nr:protein kinase [Thermoactinospora rubra]